MNNGLYLQKIKIMLYPFNSFQFFEIGNKVIKGEKESEVLDQIFHDIREGFYTTKKDSFNMIVEKYWNKEQNNMQRFSFRDFDEERYMFNTCRNIARKYFYLKDGTVYVDGNKNEKYIDFIENEEIFDEILEVGENHNNKFQWYYLKHMIDVDILIASYMADNEFIKSGDYEIWRNPVQTTNAILDKMLKKGMGETHLHLGAGKSFLSIWTDLMNDRLIERNSFAKAVSKMTIETHRGYIKLENYIKLTKIIRVLLGKYLNNKGDLSFEHMIKSIDEAMINQFDKVDDNDFYKKYENLCVEYMNGAKFDTGKSVNYQKYFDMLKEIYKLDYNELRNHECNLIYKDIITSLFDEFYGKEEGRIFVKNLSFNIAPEHILLTKAMHKIKDMYENNEMDKNFISIFNQYIRIKNVVYKFFIQQVTAGKGLDIFSEYYGNQKVYGSESFYEDVLDRQIANGNMRKLEVRIGTNASEEKVRKNLRDLFKGYKVILMKNEKKNVTEIPQLGVVFHFIKRDVRYHNNCYYNHINFEGDKYSRENKQCSKYEMEAKVISKLRSEIPYLDMYIVGVDAASKENDAEPFIFKRAYELLRNPKNVRKMSNGMIGFKKDIGFTYHVGEEFRDIISGLRHVDEVVEYLRFRNGDRIGHGIVLGIDIDKWASTNQVVYIPVDEYMDNLMWEWSLYVSDREYRDFDNISYIENQIMDLAERIFGNIEGITVRDLYMNYQKKMLNFKIDVCPHKDECFIQKQTYTKHIAKKRKMSVTSNTLWNRDKIFAAINCKYFLKEFKKVVAINMSSDLVEKYKKLQQYMRSKVSNRGIIIEVNPTSNIMIGDFSAYEDYHILNLSSPENEEAIVTINTDDPVVFSTMLKDEFALIYDIVVKSNKYSSKEIIGWLDKVRQNGIDYSFIQDRELNREQIIEEVEAIIAALK